jgi:hypothetical protein
MTQLEQSAVRNRLLAALSPNDFVLLAPALKPIRLELKRVLYESRTGAVRAPGDPGEGKRKAANW